MAAPSEERQPFRKKPQSYDPTALQVAYRHARAEAVARGQAITDASLAARINCRAATISTWKRDAAFREWLDADARAAIKHLWLPILHTAAQLAAEGSVEHMKFLSQFMCCGTATAGRPMQVLIGMPKPSAGCSPSPLRSSNSERAAP